MRYLLVSVLLLTVSLAFAKETVYVPSDPNAVYDTLGVKKSSWGSLMVLTRRASPSEISFSLREINCSDNTFRYIVDNSTLEDIDLKFRDTKLLKFVTDTVPMKPLTPESISSYIAIDACASAL